MKQLFAFFVLFNTSIAYGNLEQCKLSEDNLVITCKDGRVYNLVTPINGLNFRPKTMTQDNTRIDNLNRDAKVRSLAGFADEPYIPANKTKGQ